MNIPTRKLSFTFGYPYRLARIGDVPHQQISCMFQQIQREKIRTALHTKPPAIRHNAPFILIK